MLCNRIWTNTIKETILYKTRRATLNKIWILNLNIIRMEMTIISRILMLRKIKVFNKIIFKIKMLKIMQSILKKVTWMLKISMHLSKIKAITKIIIKKRFSSQSINISCIGRSKVPRREHSKVLWTLQKHQAWNLKILTSIWQKMSKKVQKF